jgi:hypothetical protein
MTPSPVMGSGRLASELAACVVRQAPNGHDIRHITTQDGLNEVDVNPSP